jgi:hypothetical protein
MDFADRLLLALEEVNLTFERRDSYLSDDDLLDAADNWTTDGNVTWFPENRDDYSALVDALFAAVTEGHSSN